MLLNLTISSYALIDQLEMSFAPGFNVITGETGTGKSIMLGALGLLLGSRADSGVVRSGSDKCVVEGQFNIEGYALEKLFVLENLDYTDTPVFRREVTATGKSRAFINDTPVTLEAMRTIGVHLMSIHSQHETIALKSKSFQLDIIDSYATNVSVKKDYELAWKAFKESEQAYTKILQEVESAHKEVDFISHQVSELDQMELQANEQARLEEELKWIENVEEIKTSLNSILIKADGAGDLSIDGLLAEVKNQTGLLRRYSERYNSLYQRIENLLLEFRDIIGEFKNDYERLDYDAQRAEEVKNRLNALNHLLHKHRRTEISELIALRDEWRLLLYKNANAEETLANAKQNLEHTSLGLAKANQLLSSSRVSVFDHFCKDVVHLLRQLGMANTQLTIAHCTGETTARGSDEIDFLFSSNKGIAQSSLSKIASGGEISRLMFCIRYLLASKTSLPTMVLDEIDTGISGEIAIRLGSMMKSMAATCQLIVITHLPQIAAKADHHFYVYKTSKEGKTVSSIRALIHPEERVMEVAKMINGEMPSAVALESARELINSNPN